MLQAKPGLAPGFVFVRPETIARFCRSGFSRDICLAGEDMSRLKPLLQRRQKALCQAELFQPSQLFSACSAGIG
ncbi:hypothetical protein JR064_18050 [Xanthomonas sp. CFBP 8703]|uniref:Transposase n=1 Tax=Xanthomonas bonasiae TaxID=2810351 RepID=A0ABS3B7N9_9XANT|nr:MULTISPECIES: hypothetical protein [Xanthomonas]MBN6104069.1 hypothetical protein [Xanthomonas bonasiae]NYF22495.1 hypothetical protein [Xanthomonas sp. JAI131]